MPVITTRHAPADVTARLIARGENPLLARLHAARGVASIEELNADLAGLEPPHRMRNLDAMALLHAHAIAAGKRLLIVADYDADGKRSVWVTRV